MPASYTIDGARRLVHSIATGVLTAAEVVTHNDHLKHDALFHPEFRHFCDFVDVSEMNLSSETIWRLARERVFAPSARQAFVVTDDLAYGLVRMFMLMRDQIEAEHLAVFRDRTAAWRWLGEG